MSNIINQRERYLAELRKKTAAFTKLVVQEYNDGMSAVEIAESHINPATDKPYSRQHIHKIIHRARANNLV